MDPVPVRRVILIVDDDGLSRALLGECLSGEYDLVEAVDGRAALEIFGRREVDLVLLDVMMPGMSGFEVCRELKKRARNQFLPVLLLTALRDQQDRNAGLAAGADDFLTKPVDHAELRLRVSALLKTREQDVTIRRQLEELRHLAVLKDDLVSLIVHDLRTPLDRLLQFLEAVREDAQDHPLREDVAHALAAGARLSELLEDVLQVRLLEEGKLTLSLTRQPFADLVAEAREALAAAARDRSVTFEVTCSGDTSIDVDRKLLRRAVENLLENGVKGSPRGGAVQVDVRGYGSGLEMSVADLGADVPAAQRDRLFDKLGALEAPARARRGHGLGLYLTRLVTAAHGGRIAARQREGGGNVFSLWLPRCQFSLGRARTGADVL